MAIPRTATQEGRLAIKFAAVSLLGFVTDAIVLRAGIGAGLEPAWARVLSLFCAMQVTFVVNGLFVFRSLDLSRPWRPWMKYMLTGGFGNFCNYWIFVTLVSTHWPFAADPLLALAAGSFAAWTINYAGARLVVFRAARPIKGPKPPA
jgi:putative flippase GtrA